MNTTWLIALALPCVATVTVALAEALPPDAVASAVYVVVVLGVTVTLPPLDETV
jgi:hypothetical protein